MDTPLHNLAFYGGGYGGGGGGAAEPERDVNFIDYDGTIVHSYTAAEFAKLTALPANPSHDGLTAQGWNWSLADAQEYVADYGKLWVGQMYITSDGKTRIYIELEEDLLTPYLGIAVNGSVDVDWGDGSAHDIVTGSSTSALINTQHTYAVAGEYVIALTVTGSLAFLKSAQIVSTALLWDSNPYEFSTDQAYVMSTSNAYQNAIKKVEIGAHLDRISELALSQCVSLKSITIPNSVQEIGNYAFQYCISLVSLVIPNSITSLDFVIYCHTLRHISLPNSLTSCGPFYSCESLANITIPDTVASLPMNSFARCRSLTNVVIPNGVITLPSHSIAYCSSLASIVIPRTITYIDSTAFNHSHNFRRVRFLGAPPTLANSTTFPYLTTSCVFMIPVEFGNLYLSATNYPNPTQYKYIGYKTFTEGSVLPSSINGVTCTWYANLEDAKSEVNPITLGNGNEVYATMVAQTKVERYTFTTNEVSSAMSLTTTISCKNGDLLVASILTRSSVFSLNSGWILLGEPAVLKYNGNDYQWNAMAYKYAESTTESLTITQERSARLETAIAAIQGGQFSAFNGYTTQDTGNTINKIRPNGLIIWGLNTLWSSTQSANLVEGYDAKTIKTSRASVVLDQSNVTSVTFTATSSDSPDTGIALGAVTITGVPNFFYYEE